VFVQDALYHDLDFGAGVEGTVDSRTFLHLGDQLGAITFGFASPIACMAELFAARALFNLPGQSQTVHE
jgi:hypothetical protein